MYYYIIENSKRKEFEKIEPKVKEILTNFDILGEFIYIDNLADAGDATKNAIEKGFSTVVAVGGDYLTNRIAVALINTKAAVGMLPLEEGILSLSLGLGNWKNACEILAARRILMMDVGMVNDKAFITEIISNQSPDIPPEAKPKSILTKLISSKPKINKDQLNQINISVQDNYQIDAPAAGLIVSNIRPYGKNIESIRQSMIDKHLHLAFSDQVSSGDLYFLLDDNEKNIDQNNISLFHAEEYEIRSEKPLFFWSSGEVIARTPAQISIIPQTLKVISGRLR